MVELAVSSWRFVIETVNGLQPGFAGGGVGHGRFVISFTHFVVDGGGGSIGTSHKQIFNKSWHVG